MAIYMVERHLPGISEEQLLAAAKSAKATTAQMRQEGVDVTYLRSTFIPANEKLYCLFEGPSTEVVEQANRRAGLPFQEVHEAAALRSEDLP